jgi:twitching motility protein PilT
MNEKPPIGAPPRPSLGERPLRPGVREEIPIPAERPMRSAMREEMPELSPSHETAPRISQTTPAVGVNAAQPGAVAMSPQVLQQLAAHVQAQVEARVKTALGAHLQNDIPARVQAQVEARVSTELDVRVEQALKARLDAEVEARLSTLRREMEAMAARLASQPASTAAPSLAAPAAATAVATVETPKIELPTHAPGTPGKNRIDRFLKLMNDRGASDLHLSVGRPPIFRLGGRMEPIRYRTLDDSDYKGLLEPICPMHLWAEFMNSGDMDFAYELPGVCRFRVNMSKQARGSCAVFRIIPTKLMTVQQLGLPEPIRKAVALRSGMVLVTGPTGSGKSTTLSAIINEMNETRQMHFVTIEDPIEFVHPNKKSLMTQREIGPHSKSFSTALRAAVREDPDAILVGEMRDLETISMALNAAETGVLVFGTLHTNSAAKTLDRIINVFPSDKQPGVRGTLASVTKCIVAQQLLRKKGGGRAAAVEILFGSNAMSSMIRDGKTHQISGLIKLGKRDGMIAMDDALKKLIEDDVIEPLAGLEKALDKDDFRKWLKDRGTDVPDDEAGGH